MVSNVRSIKSRPRMLVLAGAVVAAAITTLVAVSVS